MNIKDHPIIVFFGTLIAVLSIAIPTTYEFARGAHSDEINTLKAQMSICKITNSIKAEKLFKSLQAASNELSQGLGIIKTLHTLQSKNADLKAQLTNTNNQLEIMTKERSALDHKVETLNKKLADLQISSQEFTLKPNNSKILGNSKFTIGLTGIDPDSVNLIVNNKKNVMQVGSYINLNTNSGPATLSLKKIDFIDNTAYFSFTIFPK